MVAVRDNTPRFTPEEYFDWEEQQLERHELIDGEVYAMSGGTKNHSRIALKFGALLDSHLGNSGCETANSDLKVNIVNSTNYTYPDVSVTCDDRDKTQVNRRSRKGILPKKKKRGFQFSIVVKRSVICNFSRGEGKRRKRGKGKTGGTAV